MTWDQIADTVYEVLLDYAGGHHGDSVMAALDRDVHKDVADALTSK